MEEIIKKIMETYPIVMQEWKDCGSCKEDHIKQFWIKSMIKILEELKVNIAPSELHWDTTRIDQAIQLLKILKLM